MYFKRKKICTRAVRNPASRVRRIVLYISAVLCPIAMLSISGCRSAYIETTLRNDGSSVIRLIEVDYPSASFGTQTLAPHAVYHYHFKVQGSGPVTLSYTSADNKGHSDNGPTLSEGQQGTLVIAVDNAGKVTWTERLTHGK
jgi:hypothetical protein